MFTLKKNKDPNPKIYPYETHLSKQEQNYACTILKVEHGRIFYSHQKHIPFTLQH